MKEPTFNAETAETVRDPGILCVLDVLGGSFSGQTPFPAEGIGLPQAQVRRIAEVSCTEANAGRVRRWRVALQSADVSTVLPD